VAALAAAPAAASPAIHARRSPAGPVLVGSSNALDGMRTAWPKLSAGAHPLDCALEVVQVTEADPDDMSVGLGGLPNERGVVQLDAACMDGTTHNSGAVACIEDILHPSAVARLVMERTDHCLLVGRGAYEFARMHGHPHTGLLTDRARAIWARWKEALSERDDYLEPSGETGEEDDRSGFRWLEEELRAAGLDVDSHGGRPRLYGTIHCSALSADGRVACTTTTSGLSFKIPGRVGDSPLVGAGLYCDVEAGSAGATGRGEAAVLANGSATIVELLRRGASPLDAGLEALERVARQATRQAAWQPALLDERGRPAFGLKFYVVGLDGRYAGVTLRGNGQFAVAGPEGEPRREELVALFD
jgi:N4-(beta-N-acetylglucosaminyl)-L-asparaginase